MQTAGTSTMWGMTQPVWREKFHLCVFDSSQVLKLVVAHNMDAGARLRPPPAPLRRAVRSGRLCAERAEPLEVRIEEAVGLLNVLPLGSRGL